MNLVALTGHLGGDLELRQTQSGKSVCTLSLAVRDGYDKDRTHWFKVVLWDKQAETASTYLKKGSQIAVTGELSSRDYTDKDGNKRTAVEVICRRFDFLDKRGDGEGQRAYRAPDVAGPDDFVLLDSDNDDLPF